MLRHNKSVSIESPVSAVMHDGNGNLSLMRRQSTEETKRNLPGTNERMKERMKHGARCIYERERTR